MCARRDARAPPPAVDHCNYLLCMNAARGGCLGRLGQRMVTYHKGLPWTGFDINLGVLHNRFKSSLIRMHAEHS